MTDGRPEDDVDAPPERPDEDDALALELDEDVDDFADELPPPRTGPVEDPNDNRLGPTFFEAGIDLHALDDLVLTDRVSVLERLGPAHFRSKGFSFMGFLQTVYDHIAEEMTKPATHTAALPEASSSQQPLPTQEAPPMPETPVEVISPGSPKEHWVRDDGEDNGIAGPDPSSRDDNTPTNP